MKYTVIATACGYYVTEIEAEDVASAVHAAEKLPTAAWRYTGEGAFGTTDVIGDIIGLVDATGMLFDEDCIQAELDAREAEK